MDGYNKAFIELGDSFILERILNSAKEIFDEIIIVTNSQEDYYRKEKRHKIISDKIRNIGPLGGIYSALSATLGDFIFVLPCDMPFVNKEVIEKQISIFYQTKCDILVPRIDGFIEPLHSIYRTNIAGKLHEFIKRGESFSIRSFYQDVHVEYLDLDNSHFNRKVFTNINTREDLKNAKNKYLLKDIEQKFDLKKKYGSSVLHPVLCSK